MTPQRVRFQRECALFPARDVRLRAARARARCRGEYLAGTIRLHPARRPGL